ncbi:TRAP transporter substrate-binding protein DctP [Hahella ganghwensis]|uniref:TRAP transporter substrate-binding protein DctP n=1 Tax=Hahella ganghwensis TaxID=286420 RepID=UPI00035CA7A6|nr:TRAP transporter substrate-binding protein DctP [Hahella ganghwensis]
MKSLIQTIIALVFTCFTGVASAQELPKTHLTVVGTWSNLSQYKNFEQPFWEQEVTEKSGGAITAEIKGFNEMGLKGGEIGRLMKQGVLDFGSTVLGYLASDNPRNEAIDLAGLSPDIATARRVSNAYRPVLAKLYKDKYNVKLLGIWPYSAQVLYCKSPISGLTDLEGKKVRTANRTLAEFVEAFGGVGVTLSFGEVVQAMQTGVVDCAITGALSGYSSKWYEVSHYLYALPVGWSQVVHGVSYDAWNDLDDRVKAFLEQEIASLEDRIWSEAGKESEQGIACNTGEGRCDYGQSADMTLVEVSRDDKVELARVLDEVVLKKWAERCGEACAAEFNDTVGKVISARIRR